MGEDTPDEIAVFDPTKWYCLHVSGYFAGAGGCEEFAWFTSCCRKGDDLIAWLPFECMVGLGTCTFPTAAAAQKLLTTDGPFVDVAACIASGCGAG